MKKYTAFIITVIYIFFTINPCFALSKSYYLQNASKNIVLPQTESVIRNTEYTIKKSNPYLAISNKDAADYSIIILQPDGKNMFYYYESNNNSKKLNKAILKQYKNLNISYEEIEDYTKINNFSQIAERTLTGKKKSYNFDEPKQSYTGSTQQNVTKTSTALTGYVGKVGKGVELDVYLQNAINTATSRVGNNVVGVLNKAWKTPDNHVIAEQGSVLYGEIIKAHGAQYGLRNGFVRISFNKLTTPEGKTYNISTKDIDFNVSNEGIVSTTIANFAQSALIGAAVGALAGLIGGGSEGVLKGVAVGAGVGGATAAISAAAEKGIDAEIPAFTNIEVVIQKDINVVIND